MRPVIYDRLTILSSVFILVLFCSCEKDEILSPDNVTGTVEQTEESTLLEDSVSVFNLTEEVNNSAKILNVQKELFDFHSNIAGFLKNKKGHVNAEETTISDDKTIGNDSSGKGYLNHVGPMSGTYEDLDYIPSDWFFLADARDENLVLPEIDAESVEIMHNQKRENSFERIVTP